jgi:hypothetical protein
VGGDEGRLGGAGSGGTALGRVGGIPADAGGAVLAGGGVGVALGREAGPSGVEGGGIEGGGASPGRDGSAMPGGREVCPGLWETLIDLRATAVATCDADGLAAEGGELGRIGGTDGVVGAGMEAGAREAGGAEAARRRPGVAGPGPGSAGNCGGGCTPVAGASASRKERPPASKLRSVLRPQMGQSQATSNRFPATSMLWAGARSRMPSEMPMAKPARTCRWSSTTASSPD